MILTIGMIVKNEEKILRRCLEALQPILKNVDSELIIVDTGSTDSTVEIAKEFTDKVLFYEWTKDFSAARNVGLKQAKGEWFMTVDADEIFLSCNDIINFFNSGEYKEYNSATFAVRNYRNEERTGRYVDFYVPRLTKILPETKYVNKVHENFNTYGKPLRLLADVADHYGYIKTRTEEKSERNTELLLQRLESEEIKPSLYRELYEAYNTKADGKEQAEEYLQKGIDLCLETKDDYILALYQCRMASCVSKGRNEEAMKTYEEYFSLSDEIKIKVRNTDLEIIGFASLALYNMHRYDEARKMMESYFDLYERIERQGIRTRDVLYIYQYISDSYALAEMHLFYVNCCMKTNRAKEMEKSLRICMADNYTDRKNYFFDRIRQETVFLNMCDEKKLASVLSEGGKFQNELFRAFRYAVLSMDSQKRIDIINKLASANLKSAPQRHLLPIYKEHFSKGAAGEARIMTYTDKHGMDCTDLLCIMLEEGINPFPYLSKCSDVSGLVENGFELIVNFSEKIKSLNINNVARGDILTAARIYLESVLGRLKNGLAASSMYNDLGNLGIMYLQAFGENSIPPEIMAAVTVAEINLLRSSRDYKGCVDALRRLLGLDKKYAPIASDLQNVIQSEMALYMK
ncbi:MAG: glycosyltransferase [Oscillospiraceae bacterium]|nr:glycosyltransferase [Oscillospiraceae bacterium]